MENIEAGGFVHDPVAAISETDATGETAAIFAEIRRCMQIPMLTSIWRTLAGIEGGLKTVWHAAKPLIESGLPVAAISRLSDPGVLPIPEPLAAGQLACAGVSDEQLPLIRAMIRAYNRSNSINFIALTAFISEPSDSLGDPNPQQAGSAPADIPLWPELPLLPMKQEISPEVWTLLESINRFGGVKDQPGMATMWRHLAIWPGFLAVVHAALAPLEKDGTIQQSIRQLLEIAAVKGQRIARIYPQRHFISEPARGVISNYVLNPGLVVRMVAIGHCVDHWLEKE